MSGARTRVEHWVVGVGGIAAARAFFEINSVHGSAMGSLEGGIVSDVASEEERDTVGDLLRPPRTREVVRALERLRIAEEVMQGNIAGDAVPDFLDSLMGQRQRQRSETFYDERDARRMGLSIEETKENQEEGNSPGESDPFAGFDFFRQSTGARTDDATLPSGVRVVSSLERPMSPDAVRATLPSDFLPPDNVVGEVPHQADSE